MNENRLEQALVAAEASMGGRPLSIQPAAVVVNLDAASNPYLAFGKECELLNASWSLDSGRTVEFRITGEAFDRIHPFKRFTQRRNGRAGTRFIAAIAATKTGEMVYHDQVMLAAWGDNSTHGQHFKLWLDEDSAQHPFAGYERRKAQNPGDLFAVGLVELNDDDTAIDQTAREKLEGAVAGQPNGGAPSGGASRVQTPAAPKAAGSGYKAKKFSSSVHLMVTGALFVRWLRETRPKVVKEWTPELAKRYVKQLLEVESLSELDRNPKAAERFHRDIRRPFEKWAHQDPGDHP